MTGNEGTKPTRFLLHWYVSHPSKSINLRGQHNATRVSVGVSTGPAQHSRTAQNTCRVAGRSSMCSYEWMPMCVRVCGHCGV